VWVHHHVVDETGEKMSKSLGNIIDPQDVLKRYGAEAMRIWTCLEGDITKGDIRCSFERIEGTAKFITKLWNLARFVSMFQQPNKESKQSKLEAADEWILAELSKLVKFVREKYLNYEFNAAVTTIRDFAWNLFAAHYVEMVKARAYTVGTAGQKSDGSESAWQTLHTCMRTLLLLLAPVIPFVTEKLWQELYVDSTDGEESSIHTEKFPDVEWDESAAKLTQALTEFNSKVWNMKKEKGLSLRDEIKIEIPQELKPMEKDLTEMHKIKTK